MDKTPGQRYADYKAGAITLEQYIAELEASTLPPPHASIARWQHTLDTAAAHRRCGLRAHELEHLARTFGGTVE
jgi:hypothetical protein